MNWNLREAARALDLPEREVLRLARRGTMPSFRLNDQYMFNPVELQEWGTRPNHKMARDVVMATEPGLGLADLPRDPGFARAGWGRAVPL